MTDSEKPGAGDWTLEEWEALFGDFVNGKIPDRFCAHLSSEGLERPPEGMRQNPGKALAWWMAMARALRWPAQIREGEGVTEGKKPGAGGWTKPKPGEWTLEDLEREGVFRDYLERRWTDKRCEKLAKAAMMSPPGGISEERKSELLWQARWRHLDGRAIPPWLRIWTDHHFLGSHGRKSVPKFPPAKPRGDAFCIAALKVFLGWPEEESMEYLAKKSGRKKSAVKSSMDNYRREQPGRIKAVRRSLREFRDRKAD